MGLLLVVLELLLLKKLRQDGQQEQKRGECAPAVSAQRSRDRTATNARANNQGTMLTIMRDRRWRITTYLPTRGKMPD